MSDLLFEIGTEELPAGFIDPALTQLYDNFTSTARDLKISYGSIRVLGTPRRLTVIVKNLASQQEDIREEIMGPSARAGLGPDGQPTKAAIGFAVSKGADVADLKTVETPKGQYLMLVRQLKGKPVAQLLPDILKKLILDLSFPKSMRWGSNTIPFARPIQWILAMLDNEVVEFELEGIRASNTSRGHRFLSNYDITIDIPLNYEKLLYDAHVLVDQNKRREAVAVTIAEAVAHSDTLSHSQVLVDEDLVDTITNLVEIPYGICGSFDEKFLVLPDDVLITSMREHQKYFPLGDKNGKLLAGFVAVNNTKVTDEAVTRKGHQRVLRARLADALFFYTTDREQKLTERVPLLKGIIFQAKLGTMLEKNERILKLTKMLAEKVAPEQLDIACRAAHLCKADLLTNMVGEFPSLQGIMGAAYAAGEGELPEVARAIREHYMPKRAGAELPTTVAGSLVGLADRFDTLAGCFGIGQVPTGTADPFGLRRIALALLQVITSFNYMISLREVVHKALALYGEKVDGSSATVDNVLSFIENRYKNDCIAKGFDGESVAAAAAVGFDNVIDCTLRIDALSKMKSNAAFAVLASSYKRIRNIIKDNTTSEINPLLLQEDAEKNLYTLLEEVRAQMCPFLDEKNYLAALETLLKMKEPVDTFFDNVMVMSENEEIKKNRLNLLTALGELVLQIGDISKMNNS